MSKTAEQYTPALSEAYLKSLAPSSFQCTAKLKWVHWTYGTAMLSMNILKLSHFITF